MKECFKCGKEFPLDDFYRHSQMKDGHLNKCKSCSKSDSTENRNRNLERVRKYDRDRGNRQPPGYQKKYAEDFPNKYKATNMVNNAIRDGKLFKESCGECGSSDYIHAHHDDYSKPLNVRWLCPAHHSQWHRDNGEGANA